MDMRITLDSTETQAEIASTLYQMAELIYSDESITEILGGIAILMHQVDSIVRSEINQMH